MQKSCEMILWLNMVRTSVLRLIQNTATLVFPLFPDEELASVSYF